MRRILCAIGVLAAIPAAASAQRWGRGDFPRAGACFFRDADFRGEYFCVSAGENVGAVPNDMNDQISSIRLFGGAEVVVFKDARFGGGSTKFQSSVRDLRDANWNDRISSLRVQPMDRRFGDLTDDQRGRDRPRNVEDPDVVVRRAYQDVLGRQPDEAGLRQYRSRIIDDHWTEEQVRNSLRASAEYRDKTTMTPAKAQDIVRRAYLNVLKREPDAGAQGYVNNVLRNNWSQDDVERELRRSPEYREKNR